MDSLTVARLPESTAAGCVFDGNRGWRISADAIVYAHERGFPVTCVDLAVMGAFREGDRDQDGTIGEYVHAMADEAIEWLNEHVTPEGHLFGWHEGDLMLWSDETWGDIDHP